jgi:NitT/TauT family transport system substrate-binding protein
MLVVSPKSLAARRDDWKKVAKVWFRIADYLADEANKADALKIMSARVGLSPDEYAPLMGGTHFLDLAGNVKHAAKGEGLESVFGSSKIVDKFNVDNDVYKTAMPVDQYFDPSIVQELSQLSQK